MRAPSACRVLLTTIAVLLPLAVSPACSSVSTPTESRSGNVGYSTIAPPNLTRLVLDGNQAFSLGEPLSSVALPAYPAELLTSQVPDQQICVNIAVSEEGSVLKVTPLFAIPDCPLTEPETNKKFVNSVTEAVSKWEFYSSQICTYPPGTQADHKCNGPGVVIVPVSVTQSFQFLFSVKAGVGTVSDTKRKG